MMDNKPLEWHTTVIGQMRTYTGRIVSPLALTPEMVDIEDIAHALARICRYGGHTEGFLSVAWHSIGVARRLDPNVPYLRLGGLLHDAYEAYSGDIIAPIKKMPEMAWFIEVEKANEAVIAEALGIPFVGNEDPRIKQADSDFLQWEIQNVRDLEDAGEEPNTCELNFLHAYRSLMSIEEKRKNP